MLSAFEEYSHIEVEYLISPRLHFLLQQMITAHVCILHERRLVWKTVQPDVAAAICASLFAWNVRNSQTCSVMVVEQKEEDTAYECSINATSPQPHHVVLWRDDQFSKSSEGAFTIWKHEGFIFYAQSRCTAVLPQKNVHLAPKRELWWVAAWAQWTICFLELKKNTVWETWTAKGK